MDLRPLFPAPGDRAVYLPRDARSGGWPWFPGEHGSIGGPSPKKSGAAAGTGIDLPAGNAPGRCGKG